MFSIDKQKKFMDFAKHTTDGTNMNHFFLYLNLINEETNELIDAIKKKECLEVVDAILDIAVVTCGAMLTVDHLRFNLELLEFSNYFENIYNSLMRKPKYLIDINHSLQILQSSDIPNSSNYFKNKLTQLIYLCAKFDIDLKLAMSKLHDNLLTKVIDENGKVIVKYREDGKILKPANFVPFNPAYILENKNTKEALKELFSSNIIKSEND